MFKNDGSGTSQGVTNLLDVYTPLQAFSLVPVLQANSFIAQSSMLAGASNSLSISLVSSGNIGKSTKLFMLLPKDSFVYITSSSNGFTL